MICWETYVNDWKVGKEEEKIFEQIYKNSTLLQITFPEFWQRAYAKRNNFFQHVFAEAKQHVEESQKYEDKKLWINEEWLKEDRCRELWHRHCDFCMKTITTKSQEKCYCSEDLEFWICAECFNNFKEHFEWMVEKIEDIPVGSIANTVKAIIATNN